MFIAAYLVARFLWLPLLLCWHAAKGAPGRGAMWLPIGVGLAATVWEAMIPTSSNIRIDLLLVAPLLMFADGLGALILAMAIRQAPAPGPRAAMAWAAGFCAMACAAFVFAWFWSSKQAEDQYSEFVAGTRYWFEAAFTDDASMRAAFGDLDATPFAGYYAADPPSRVHAHLVVNRAGDFWVFGPEYRTLRGRVNPDPVDKTLAFGPIERYGQKAGELQLRDRGDGRLEAVVTDVGAPQAVGFARRAPPRFARADSASGPVKFKGVFSGADESDKHVFVTQLWLWESDGRTWGKLFRQGFTRGQSMEAVGQRDATVKCIDSPCTSIEVKSPDDAAFKYQWDGPDRLLQKHGYQGRDVVLKRGEIIGGFLYERAPVSSPDENRKWLRSVHPVVAWTAPGP